MRIARGKEKQPDTTTILLGPAVHALSGGLVLGLLFAIVAGITLQSYLYGLSPLDPISYLIVILVLAVAAMLATYIPARRACGVDPVMALRHE